MSLGGIKQEIFDIRNNMLGMATDHNMVASITEGFPNCVTVFEKAAVLIKKGGFKICT